MLKKPGILSLGRMGAGNFPGDLCRDDGYCQIVLSSKGGQLDESKRGQVYDAFYGADGPYCESPDGGEGNDCYPGDLCRDDGKCEVDKSIECGWQLIHDRLEAIDQLERLDEVLPPKDWSTAHSGGPRRRIREDVRGTDDMEEGGQ